MVRVQISGFDQSDFADAAKLLSLCAGARAEGELAEYIKNPAVHIFCARGEKLYGIILIMPAGVSCDILDIAVDKGVRRRGVASALLAYTDEFCRAAGITEQLLEVRASNTDARAFYERAGFEEIARRKNYYSAPIEDAAVMRRGI